LEVLNEWRASVRAVTQDRVRRIQETDDPMFAAGCATRACRLKRTGGVRPPREFVLMDRSAIALAACSCG